ncbi:LysR family transcriptional regulator [Vibrio chagasii]|uniref:LysR family transcriptional regulator n=1 Tax=Vibrio TaxID=662 RepID=UPI000D4BE5CA|nr:MULTISPECIES: LysR family transcriptional regulator [Vibrio]MDE9380556.1 LysR family transcriptional regulator [Vibrio alginolyticus]MCG9604158.1 LysR family transcriptional regulator [Vibrio chagasii]MCG9673027.1 LysR family transcriptional regulator [Vibrio chagasii]PQJ48704.1 LysR family transcriptional regulator [Vibrio splendidus]CAH6794213.1 LysR family transcriptional regulator [Vibrio chagasii]
MDKYRNMQLFCTVVDRGSFSKAAKALGITPAIVGRHIAAMEESLGFRLLNRTTRSMHLTPGGKAYYEGAQTVLSQIEQLEDSLTTAHQNNPEGLIRLSAPDAMGPFLMKAIKDFRAEYSGIRFDLALSNSKSNLIEEEIDLSIRFAFELQDSSYIATKLGESEFGLYAAPSYIDAHHVPSNYSDLKNHDCLHMGSSRDGDYWMLTVDGKSLSYRQQWVAVISDTNTLIQATVDGMGIAMIPSVFVNTHIINGDLIKIENVAEFPIVNIYGMYPTRKHVPYRLSLFLEYLKANLIRIVTP